MNLHTRYPAISDLRRRARRRIPHFIYEYLESGTGDEATVRRNRQMLDQVLMLPSILHGNLDCELSTTLFGASLAYPFGIAPVGMSGLVWPGAEIRLARAAAEAGIPYCLSTVAAETPENLAPHLGEHAWFQLYAPKDPGILRDMLDRVKKAGFKVLVLTVDVPVASRRERQTRSGLTQPPRLTPRLLWQIARRPVWALEMSQRPKPRMRFLEKYLQDDRKLPSTEHIGYLLRTSPDPDYLETVRREWNGPLVLKGIMDPGKIASLEGVGIDGLWVSNHAGRQFDGAPASIEMLPAIRQATKLPLVFDSGISGGLDILRALALGADFVMLGRAWHYALGALGDMGPKHLIDMLARDMAANMGQIGARNFQDLPSRIYKTASNRTHPVSHC